MCSSQSQNSLNDVIMAMASVNKIPKKLRTEIINMCRKSNNLLNYIAEASKSEKGLSDDLQQKLIKYAEHHSQLSKNHKCLYVNIQTSSLEPETEDLNTNNHKENSLLKNKPTNSIKIYNPNDVRQRLKLVADDREHKLEHSILSDMLEHNGEYTLRGLPKNFLTIMEEMDAHYPHFHQVTDFLRNQMVIAQLQQCPALSFGSNLLLNGPAGVGKSSYLMMLSKKMGTLFINYSCAATSNGFDLTGLSARWGTGRAGKLYETIIGQSCPNPIILLDEVEKASADERTNFQGTLYTLLERNNARSFRDEFIDIPMDASKINWFATSNNVDHLDRALQDRFVVLEVESPNETELTMIIPHLYKELIVENKLHHALSEKVSKAVVTKLAQTNGISIRVVKNMLMQALSSAAMRGKGKGQRKLFLQVDDLPDTPNKIYKEKPMGYIWK